MGWQISTSLRSDLAIDALEMAIYSRNGEDLSDLVHHSDRGVQYLSIRFTERLAGAEILASVGSKGDSYDNALAESFNGLYKTELIHRQGPWRNVEHVEWATPNYVDWFNNQRIHESLDYVPPVEFEAHYYGTNESESLAVLEMIQSPRNPARFRCESIVAYMSELQLNRPVKIYLLIFSGASVLSTAVAWIYSSYFQNDFATLLVFYGQDGNCDAATQGLGVHCFGDYSAIHFSNLFQEPQGAEIVYPIITRIFRLPFLIVESISGYRVGLTCYLLALLCATLFPILHSYFTGRVKLTLPLWLCISCINIGTISSLDRGNVIAFAVPFLYLFLIKFQDNSLTSASKYLTLAAMVKPQLMLFAVVFLWRREIKTMLLFSVNTVVVIFIPYLVFGTRSMTVLKSWIDETVSWSKSLPPTDGFPTNYSFNRILGIADVNYSKFSFILGAILLAAVSFTVVRKKRRIEAIDLIKVSLIVLCMNSIVYVYYSVLLIPLWVILFSIPSSNPDENEKPNGGEQFAPYLLALATAPLAWPSRWRMDDDVSASGAYNVVPILISLGVVVFVVYTTVCSFRPSTAVAIRTKGNQR